MANNISIILPSFRAKSSKYTGLSALLSSLWFKTQVFLRSLALAVAVLRNDTES